MKLNDLFCNGAVFQAGKPIRVFGEGNGVVEVHFLGKTYKANSEKGKWLVELPSMPYGGPYGMTVCLGSEEKHLSDLYIGDVVLVAGQSNVQFRVDEEQPQRPYAEDKLLRFFAVDRLEEDDKCFRAADGWKDATDGNTGRHSAVGYHVGRMLRKKNGAAVGIVECYQGASIIQSWMSISDAQRKEFYLPMHKRHQDFTKEECKPYFVWNADGKLFNSMFLRIAPYSYGSVIWYQGESNTSVDEGELYDQMLATMIKSWREELRDATLPFVVVVIADLDCRNDDGWRAVQAAQRRMQNTENGIFVVESADICDSLSIHPSDKLKLSERIFDTIKLF